MLNKLVSIHKQPVGHVSSSESLDLVDGFAAEVVSNDVLIVVISKKSAPDPECSMGD